MPAAEARQARGSAEGTIPPPETWRLPYEPLVRHGDLQTVLGRYWPRRFDEGRFPGETRLFETEPGTTVLARVNRREGGTRPEERPAVLAVHGLTACDRAPYMLTVAKEALEGGYDCFRLNVRNCGGTEHLCRTLYHSGLTTDLRSVVDALAPRPLLIVGFSMGGNIALKLAGEWGERAPAHVRGICAVSPPIRLDLCSRNIGRRRNTVYERRFLWQLRATMSRKRSVMPELFPSGPLPRPRSIWQFDERVTAPAFGFRNAAEYYRRSSAAAYLPEVAVPTLVIQGRDDPFIPFEAFDVPALSKNPWLALLAPRNGGHVAFLSTGRHRFWAEAQTIRFFRALGGRAERRPGERA